MEGFDCVEGWRGDGGCGDVGEGEGGDHVLKECVFVC